MSANMRKMHRRVFFIFMLWRIYIANSRSVWVYPINSLHMQKGEFYTLYLDLRHFQPKFDRLLTLVGPKIQKKWTKFRSPISPEQKLIITLRYTIYLVVRVNAQYKTTKAMDNISITLFVNIFSTL